jgi:hypothetical protein
MSEQPTSSQVEAALRTTTEVLAAELGTPTDVRPDWTAFEWCIARAVVAMHGVSPLLSRTLRWKGPLDWEAFLQQQWNHTYLRHLRIDELLNELDVHSQLAGIAFVPLKGAELHAMNLYRIGDRPMADIDLLVAERDRTAMQLLLQEVGFHQTAVNWRHAVFEPDGAVRVKGIGEHVDNPLKIELHTRIAERLPVVEQDLTSLIWPADAHPGANRYPSQAALMTHLLMHAAGNMCISALRMIQLHDMALLGTTMTSGDWQTLLVDAADRRSWWMSAPLRCLARYYPSAAIEEAIVAIDRQWPLLPRLVRRSQSISEVSMSSLRVRAFPGIRWSGSLPEMWRYVAGRLRPDAETKQGRQRLAQQHPGAAADPWVHLSQGRRVIRWLVARPARMETMSSVNAALTRSMDDR